LYYQDSIYTTFLDVLKKIASQERSKDLFFNKDQMESLKIVATTLNMIEKGKFLNGFVQVSYSKFLYLFISNHF